MAELGLCCPSSSFLNLTSSSHPIDWVCVCMRALVEVYLDCVLVLCNGLCAPVWRNHTQKSSLLLLCAYEVLLQLLCAYEALLQLLCAYEVGVCGLKYALVCSKTCLPVSLCV